MQKILIPLLLLVLPAAFAKESAPAPGVPPKIPVRDFFRNPESRGYLLSPDGKSISTLGPWESRMNIWIRPAGGGEAKLFNYY